MFFPTKSALTPFISFLKLLVSLNTTISDFNTINSNISQVVTFIEANRNNTEQKAELLNYINNLFNVDSPLTKLDYKKYIVDSFIQHS